MIDLKVFALPAAVLGIVLSVMAAPLHVQQAAAQESELVWQFDQSNDPSNKGRSTAYLTFGIPETDAVQLSGTCAAGSSGNFAVVHLGADIGQLAESARVKVRFSGGGEEHTLKGVVYGTQLEEGISGVLLHIDNDDPVWLMLQRLDEVSYQVPGYGATALQLTRGRNRIAQFNEACRSYAAQFAGNGNTQPPPSNDGISEKEAFQAARDLGTAEAWQAFLNNFPTGFRADLARAYLKELGGGQNNTDVNTNNTNTNTNNQNFDQNANQAPEQTVDLGAGTSPWRNINMEMDEGNTTVYAAAVESNGIEFVAWCTPKKDIGAIMRESRRGVYPDFDGRIARGLKAALGTFQDYNNSHIPMRFNNGSEYYVTAAVMGLTGEVTFIHNVEGFRANGRIVQDIMGQNTMTISAPPFSATFQLNGSRTAMCSMLRNCGLAIQGCTRQQNTTTTNTSPCGSGAVWLEGQCVKHGDVESFCGPGYKRQGTVCVSRYQETVPQCPQGLTWEVDRCVEDD